MRPVRCVVCGKAAQVASISHYLYIHDCEINQTRWYTNNLIWSTRPKEVTAVARQTPVPDEQARP